MIFRSKELILNNRFKNNRDITPDMNLAQYLNPDGIVAYTFISANEKLAFFCLKPKDG